MKSLLLVLLLTLIALCLGSECLKACCNLHCIDKLRNACDLNCMKLKCYPKCQ